MAIHTLAVMNVPMVIIQKINSILSNFFWGNIDGSPITKWRAWSKICKPSEGGMGIRDLKEVQRALHMKMAWCPLLVDNVWTSFFRATYLKRKHVYTAIPVD